MANRKVLHSSYSGSDTSGAEQFLNGGAKTLFYQKSSFFQFSPKGVLKKLYG